MTRILIVEDQPNFREGLAEILFLNSYEVVTAQDGPEGVHLAREHLPDIIICDIMMPELDGYEVLRELRNDSSTAAIPFVFLTAKAENPNMRLGMELGADDYLTKPFREAELLAAIKTRLQKRATVEAQQLRILSRRFIRLEEDEYWTAALQSDSIKQRIDLYQAGDPEADSYNALTTREREILKMVAKGFTSKQIAGTLSINPRTAETHRSNIAHKLGLRTQSELIRYSIKHGLVPSGE